MMVFALEKVDGSYFSIVCVYF